MTTIEQLVQSIDSHLETLGGEIKALERARQDLLANDATSARADSAPAQHPARRRGRSQRRRPPNERTPVHNLHRLLAASDGLSAAALAAKANAEPAEVLPLLRDMEAAGRARRTGTQRGAQWHAVASEEEWIAQRAAELAARSNST